MALYQEGSYLHHTNHEAFDSKYSPGVAAPHSGIYRCVSCGDEYACNKGNPLPPQNHRQHPTTASIQWKLLVYSQVKD